MSLLDTYRRKVQQKNEEVARLLKDKANQQKKVAELSGKINRISPSIGKTKSITTIQSKLREVERLQNEAARGEKKVADLETKIAKKQKELGDEQKKVVREEEKELKKRNRETNVQARDQKRQMSDISGTLAKHDRLHSETQSALEMLQQLPEKITVLFMATNPIDQPQLRLDEEARTVAEMIRKAKHRDAVKLESCWAVRPLDVLQGINEYQPAIVHFSGHGSTQDEIVFQDGSGNTKLVTKDAIVQTMMAGSDSIRLVFFNTCYSRGQAEAVVEHVEAAIGMKTTIGDKAARIFSAQFYSVIGFGLSVHTAFEQAKAALMLEGVREEDTPELFVREGYDPAEIVIVKPLDRVGL